MPQTYFGEPWDVPAVDDAIAGPTPVGERCVYCPDLIEEGDQGFLLPTARVGPDEKLIATVEPIHRECMVRSIIGSVPHLEGRCRCRGATEDEPDNESWRDQGRATTEWLRRHGRFA